MMGDLNEIVDESEKKMRETYMGKKLFLKDFI